MNMLIKGAALLAMLGLLSGCATSRSVIDLDAKPSTSAAKSVPVLDAAAPVVTISAIADQRIFKVDPPYPREPSLMNDADIANKAITARAIARKRNGYGMGLGDVLLPEGDSVAAHVGRALSDGFRAAGYRVLKAGDAGIDQATPVSATIKQYWCWAQPGLPTGKFNCVTQIAITGKLPALTPGKEIGKQVWMWIAFGVDAEWRDINQKALQDITDELTVLLKGNVRSTAGN